MSLNLPFPRSGVESPGPSVGAFDQGDGPTIFSRSAPVLFKHPWGKGKNFGWVDEHLEVISHAREADPDFDHGPHTSSGVIDDIIRDRNGGKRNLTAKEAQAVKHAYAAACTAMGVQKQTKYKEQRGLEDIADILRDMPAQKREQFANYMADLLGIHR